MPKKENTETAKQVGKFGIVGIINTLVDVIILNVLYLGFGVKKEVANVISVSVAIVNSYILNKSWTFKDKDKNVLKQFVIFVGLSLVGLVINTYILKFLSETWTAIPDLAVSVVHYLRLNGILSDEFMILNTAKAFAILASMVWNFISYKKWAFKH